LQGPKITVLSTKSIDKKTYHTRATSKFRVKYIPVLGTWWAH